MKKKKIKPIDILALGVSLGFVFGLGITHTVDTEIIPALDPGNYHMTIYNQTNNTPLKCIPTGSYNT